MKKQIHENFESILVSIKDGKIAASSKKALKHFLNASHIHARSISAIHNQAGNQEDATNLLICIGHDVKKTKKDMYYDVSLKKLSNAATDTIGVAIENLNKFSAKAKNIVCHSLLAHEGSIYAVLLTTKEVES